MSFNLGLKLVIAGSIITLLIFILTYLRVLKKTLFFKLSVGIVLLGVLISSLAENLG